jgi:hypothetical protein
MVSKANLADDGSSNSFRIWMGPHETDRELWSYSFQKERTEGVSLPQDLILVTQVFLAVA